MNDIRLERPYYPTDLNPFTKVMPIAPSKLLVSTTPNLVRLHFRRQAFTQTSDMLQDTAVLTVTDIKDTHHL